MFKKLIKNIIVGDPYAQQKRYERMAQKRAKAGRAIDAGVESYRIQRYGTRKLNKQEQMDIMKFKKEIMAPQKKKSFDSIINDFIPNPQNVGRVDVSFKKLNSKNSLGDLASF